MGEVSAVVGQNGLDLAGSRLDQPAQEIGSDTAAGALVQLGNGELAEECQDFCVSAPPQRVRHLATVCRFSPQVRLSSAIEACRSLCRNSGSVRCRGASVACLDPGASFVWQHNDKQSYSGIKYLVRPPPKFRFNGKFSPAKKPPRHPVRDSAAAASIPAERPGSSRPQPPANAGRWQHPAKAAPPAQPATAGRAAVRRAGSGACKRRCPPGSACQRSRSP